MYSRSLPSAVNTVASEILALHANAPLWIAHLPLEDVRVNPSPEDVAVNPAHVPVVYHVPPDMMQPFLLPEVMTFRYPLPEKGVPVEVGVLEAEVDVLVGDVLVGDEEEPLGRYLMPVAGQEEVPV